MHMFRPTFSKSKWSYVSETAYNPLGSICEKQFFRKDRRERGINSCHQAQDASKNYEPKINEARFVGEMVFCAGYGRFLDGRYRQVSSFVKKGITIQAPPFFVFIFCLSTKIRMNTGPFRSHLLQQWGRSSQGGRAPAAVSTWLKSSSSPEEDSSSPPTDVDFWEREEGGTTPKKVLWNHHPHVHHHHVHHHATPRLLLPFDSSSIAASSSSRWDTSARRTTQRNESHPPSSSSHHSARRSIPQQASIRTYANTSSSPSSSSLSPHTTTIGEKPIFESQGTRKDEIPERRTTSVSSNSSSRTGKTARRMLTVARTPYRTEDDIPDEEYDNDKDTHRRLASAFQSLLMNRRTATHFKGGIRKSPLPPEGGTSSTSIAVAATGREDIEQEAVHLRSAMDRAVKCAQMAPNHKRTEPFSLKRLLAGSKAASHLADISYHVTLRKPNSSEANAETKRQKWLTIPGFLVMLVHHNQTIENDRDVHPTNEDDDKDRYAPLPYAPPTTERQLEDVSMRCDLGFAVTNISNQM